MKKLKELTPPPNEPGKRIFVFDCPACGEEHTVTNEFGFNGDINNPTFDEPVKVIGAGESVCHFRITDGMIEFNDDCTHAMAGEYMEMLDMEPPVGGTASFTINRAQ